MRHRLLVVGAKCGETLALGVEGLGEAGDVAVAENSEHAGKKRDLAPTPHSPTRKSRA